MHKRDSSRAGPKDFYRNHFSNYLSWLEFNKNIFISLKYRYVYIAVAKVACTTVKHRLQSMECADLGSAPDLAHTNIYGSPFTKPYQLSFARLEEIFFGDDFFRFGFVRNPNERVLSCYLNKIAGMKPQRSKILKAFNLTDEEDFNFSFDHFLQLISRQAPLKMNKHWRPQSTLLFIPKVQYGLIGRLEAFDEDWQIVVDHIAKNGGSLSSEMVKRAHATDAANRIRQHYNSSTWEAAGKVYKADFKAFGYPIAYPDWRSDGPEP